MITKSDVLNALYDAGEKKLAAHMPHKKVMKMVRFLNQESALNQVMKAFRIKEEGL